MSSIELITLDYLIELPNLIERITLFLDFIDILLGILTEITSDINCFHHSDKFIISKKDNKISKIKTEHPLISLYHNG